MECSPNTNKSNILKKQVMLRGGHIREREGRRWKLKGEYG
jgi:hypothetical protein